MDRIRACASQKIAKNRTKYARTSSTCRSIDRMHMIRMILTVFFCPLVSCAKAPTQSVAIGAANDIRIERCARLTPVIACARAASNLFGFQTHDKVYGKTFHVIWAHTHTSNANGDFAHYPGRSNVACLHFVSGATMTADNSMATMKRRFQRSARWPAFDMNEKGYNLSTF